MAFKEKFLALWQKYFGAAPLPISFYYSDMPGRAAEVKPGSGPRCIIGALIKVRNGESLAFNAASVGCLGGKRYLGFAQDLRPDFKYFLSCGIPGEVEGERYKKTPAMVTEYLKNTPRLKAPGRFIIFKRWDKLEEPDRPEVVVFFAAPDILAGLFTLASYDETAQNMVISPFGSGCATIVQYPYLEAMADRPRAVIGMFDISARPYIPADVITFAAPLSKFTRMVDNMEESFLITASWARIHKRIKASLPLPDKS